MAQQFATVQQLFALNCELRKEITSAAATVHHHPEFSDFLCQALEPCKACLQDLYNKQKTLESHIGALISGLEQLQHAHLSLAAAPLEDAENVKQNESKLALLQEECRAKFSKQDAELRRLEDMIAGAGKSEIAGAHTSAEKSETAVADASAGKSETAGADTMQEGASADQPVSRADLQELRSYELQGSIWDACMLIRFPALGWFEDLHLLFGVLVNICCQGFFCVFVQVNMTEEVVNELTVEAAKHWRSSIGHSVENVNALSGTSLVARLCAQDPATSAANAQLSIYGDLDSFISPSSSHFEHLVGNFLNGRTLCMFSLMLWYLTLSFDFAGNLKFACALFSLPRETRQLTFTDDSGIKIRSISASHCVLVILLSIIPRMVMTTFLGISGTHFLSYTSNTEELLLNAIALEFVLNIDEMIFEAVAPHRVRMLMGKLMPIEVELFKEKKKQDEGLQKMMINFGSLANMQTFTRVLVIAVLLVVVDQTYLLPYRQHMQDVTKWLCDGRKDFAYAINKASGVVHFSATRPHSEVYPTGYAQEAVIDITGVLGTKSTSTPWYSNYQDVAYHHEQWQRVQEISSFDVEFSASWPICFDVFDIRASLATGGQAQQRALRSFLGNESLMSCSDVDISLCHESNMNFLRGSCPDYCGCDKPWSGNFYGTASNGCPRACNQWNQEKLDLLEDIQDMKPYLEECQDVPSEILSAKKEWQWWVSAFYDFMRAPDPHAFELFFPFSKATAIGMGCSFFPVASELGFTACNPESSPGRSGRAWCPSTCGCAAGMSECPGQMSTCKCQMGSCSKLYSKTTGDGTTNCSSVRLQETTCPTVVAGQSS